MSSELENFELQLSEVSDALAKDPTNEDLKSLRDELQNLVDLTRQLAGQSAPAQTESSASRSAGAASTSSKSKATSSTSASASGSGSAGPSRTDSPAASSSSTPTPRAVDPPPASASLSHLTSGDDCLARYSGDNKFYPAKILAIGGGDANQVYSVKFHGYNDTVTLPSNSIRPLPESRKRQLEKEEKDSEREKKKKRYEKKAENKEKKAVEQVDKQAKWQAFAKKSVKKGVHIPGVSGESIFKSPDGPGGKVGVVGSGKAMTSYSAKGKHKFGE